jgi:hypothetical protein
MDLIKVKYSYSRYGNEIEDIVEKYQVVYTDPFA